MSTAPTAQKWLNYNADVTEMVGQVVGPNTFGEYLTCVEVTYDPSSGTSRSGFVYGIYKVAPEVLTPA